MAILTKAPRGTQDILPKDSFQWRFLETVTMETAALFTIGRLRGMKTASILNNVVLYGEDTADSIGDYVGGESATAKGERLEILTALEAFYLLETRDGK